MVTDVAAFLPRPLSLLRLLVTGCLRSCIIGVSDWGSIAKLRTRPLLGFQLFIARLNPHRMGSAKSTPRTPIPVSAVDSSVRDDFSRVEHPIGDLGQGSVSTEELVVEL